MNFPLPISVPVVTLNEESNLERCLSSLQGLAAEIVIVDSGSTDGTRSVAEKYHAAWSHQNWLGFQAQKAVALAQCTQPWVLSLDADEELSDELRAEIVAFFANGRDKEYQGASFPRKVWFLGRWITHGDWYPDRKLRLVRRDVATSGGNSGHDKIELTPGSRVLEMKGDLHHYSFPTMSRYISKINGFSDAALKQQLAKGKRWSLFSTIFRPWWRFFRAYFLRLGFLDGFPGFWIASSTAYQALIRYSRLYEHELGEHASSPPSKR